jgi:hypothetical protein
MKPHSTAAGRWKKWPYPPESGQIVLRPRPTNNLSGGGIVPFGAGRVRIGVCAADRRR